MLVPRCHHILNTSLCALLAFALLVSIFIDEEYVGFHQIEIGRLIMTHTLSDERMSDPANGLHHVHTLNLWEHRLLLQHRDIRIVSN